MSTGINRRSKSVKARQIEATFQDPSETIFKRAGLKLDHLQTLRQHYGDNYPKRVLARSSTALKLFPHIRQPGRDKLVAACQQVLRATGFERALLAAGASKKIIERARSFDHTKKSIYELCTEGLTFAKADAAARTPFMQQIVPFDPHNPDRIAIAARNLIKAECNMRGDGGRSLPLIQADLFREYSLEGGKDGHMRFVPFYALPYRLPGGGIQFPHRGSGWYMRDDAIFVKRWLEKFVSMGLASSPDRMPVKMPAKHAKLLCLSPDESRQGFIFRADKGMLFHPGSDEKPCAATIQREFDERARIKKRIKETKIYDIAELAIKLPLNSIYGKFAQSVGGSNGRPPARACPFWAAAITAQTRRKIGEAMLYAPHDVIQVMTDGVHFTKLISELKLGDQLGDWEHETIKDLVVIQSGVYTHDQKTKTRGFNPASLREKEAELLTLETGGRRRSNGL